MHLFTGILLPPGDRYDSRFRRVLLGSVDAQDRPLEEFKLSPALEVTPRIRVLLHSFHVQSHLHGTHLGFRNVVVIH